MTSRHLCTVRKPLLVGVMVCFGASAALAQGANDCAQAQVISGTGIFQYDTKKATTDGPLEAFWAKPGLYSMHNDVWFSWKAPSTAVYRISTCFKQTQWAATFVAVYAYGCPKGPGRAVEARGGYDCGLFTQIDIGTKAGTTYLIRIGHSTPRNRDDGRFSITKVGNPKVIGTAVYAKNGRTYHLLEPSSWSVAQAAAVALGGNLVTVNDKAENDWLNATFANFAAKRRSFWIGLNDAEQEGKWTWVSGEQASFRNWSKDAPNNGNQYEHYVHFRKNHTDGTWNDLVGFPQVSFFYNAVHGLVEVNNGHLEGTPLRISAASGGSQQLALRRPKQAGARYLLMGTASGTTPGLLIGSLRVPLNVDAYLLYTMSTPNTPLLSNSWGTLDSARATARFKIPPLPGLAGLTLHHAFVTLEKTKLALVTASNAVPVYLTR